MILHTDLFPGILVHAKGGRLELFRGLVRVDLEGPRHLAWSPAAA